MISALTDDDKKRRKPDGPLDPDRTWSHSSVRGGAHGHDDPPEASPVGCLLSTLAWTATHCTPRVYQAGSGQQLDRPEAKASVASLGYEKGLVRGSMTNVHDVEPKPERGRVVNQANYHGHGTYIVCRLGQHTAGQPMSMWVATLVEATAEAARPNEARAAAAAAAALVWAMLKMCQVCSSSSFSPFLLLLLPLSPRCRRRPQARPPSTDDDDGDEKLSRVNRGCSALGGCSA